MSLWIVVWNVFLFGLSWYIYYQISKILFDFEIDFEVEIERDALTDRRFRALVVGARSNTSKVWSE